MTTTAPKLTKVDNVWYYTAIIAYSNNKAFKRFYNLNGQLVDSKPIRANAIKLMLKKG
jgi:hypothetical protein